MIDTSAIAEMTQEQMQKMRDTATMTLINNQECYVAQWILQNPFLKVSDYYLHFQYDENSNTCYRVSMEKKPNV